MPSIILLTNCRIAGEPYEASDEPIQVSEQDAKLLISMKYAKSANSTSKPAKAKPAPVASSEP